MLRQFLTVLSILFLFLSSVSQVTDVCSRATDIIKTAEKHHYNPRSLDDDFSQLVYDEFWKNIDSRNSIFSKESLEGLNKYELEIDDLLLKKECNLIEEITEVYLDQNNYIKELIFSFKKAPFDYNKEEYITFGSEKKLKSQSELDEYWRKKIKYLVLSSYLSDSTQNEKPSSEDLFKTQQRVIDKELCLFDKALTIEDVENIYLNAIAFAYDPHSSYFSPEGESEFDVMLSKESYSFGFELLINDVGEYEIVGLVPGGPAWKSNQINEGDVLLSVKVKDETLNLYGCNAIDDIRELFARKNGKNTVFGIRKVNGDVIDVQLSRDVIAVKENVIQSFILNQEKKIGYLYLPSFYVSSSSSSLIPNGCANDIAKELIKLKREGVEGLILDLRDNGGGSMQEAIRMIGIFVDYGTVCMIDSRHVGSESLKDMDRGTIFDKPLIVMTNSFSASASELFAAAIQDYNRGVLVGSTTFGKGTAQSVLSIDAFKYEGLGSSEYSKNGYLKLTHSKFFRVTGKSHQNKGIVPDVFVPNKYDFVNISENDYASSLDSSTIDKKSYYRPLNSLPITFLKEKSNARISNDSLFLNLIEKGKTIAKDYIKEVVPIEYDSFLDYNTKKIEGELIFDSNYKVENPSYIKGISDAYDSEIEINQSLMTDIAADLQINESYNIILDLINHK